MSGFFKKALGLFVEFDEDANASPKTENTPFATQRTFKVDTAQVTLTGEEIEKFESHFDRLFNGANLPGPDYFEFSKMMDTLETHIPDEPARIAAVFASLNIQGLTKQKIIETANHYYKLVETDKAEFEKAVNAKMNADINGRKSEITQLETKAAENAEMIKKLTQEIADAKARAHALQSEIAQEEKTLVNNKGGYNIACQAMLVKIQNDIEKINTTLK